MSSGLYPLFNPGPGDSDKVRIEGCERNILDLYKILAGLSFVSMGEDAEFTALMQGSGAATRAMVTSAVSAVGDASAMEARGVSRTEVQRMLDDLRNEISQQARGISRAEAQRMVEEAVQAASMVQGISRSEVRKMIDDAMTSVIMD